MRGNIVEQGGKARGLNGALAVLACSAGGLRVSATSSCTWATTAARSAGVVRSSRSRSSQNRTKSQSETARLPDQPNSAAPAVTAVAAPAATVGAVAAPAAALAAATGKETSPTAETISTPEEIKSAQEHLRYLGYDVPDATGALDLKTKIAIMRFQDSAGDSSTGVLTVEQLQLLFKQASERQARTN
jgi:Putative peptidoglycan binding domain